MKKFYKYTLAALRTICILWIISVLLWTITILNLNSALENCCFMDVFNFINFLSDGVIQCFAKGSSYCCFLKAVSKNYFQKVLLINFTGTYSNLLNHFIFAYFLQIEGYREGSLRKSWLLLLSYNRHFRPKLVHWNESVYYTTIDRALKMLFNDGSGSFLRPAILELCRLL